MLDTKHKKMIDYALIFNIVLMIVYFLLFVDDNLFFISIMTIFGLTTLNLYNFKKLDYQVDKYDKAKFIISGIFLLVFNTISAILLFIVASKIDESNSNITRGSPIEKIDPEIRKLDILLKLGVGMVIVSGLIFSTSTWDYINDIFKMILLIVIGGAFLGLSIFSDQKLKIEKTTKTYWLVGMSFLFFAFLSIGYFGLLGETFKFGGVEEDLFVGSLLIFTSLLTFVTYYKFKNELYLNSSVILIILGLCSIFANFNLDFNYVLIGVNIALLILLLLSNKFKNMIEFIVKFFIVFTILFYDNIDSYLLIGINLIIVTFMTYILSFNKNSKLAPFILILNFIIAACEMNFDFELGVLLTSILVAGFYIMLIFCNYKENNKDSYKTYQILQNIVYLFTSFILLDEEPKFSIIGTSLILLSYVVYILFDKKKDEKFDIELYSGPFKVAFLVAASLDLLSAKPIYIYIIIFLVSGLMHLIVNEEKLKFEYFLFFIGFYFITVVETDWTTLALPGLILLIYSVLLYYYTKLSIDKFFKSINIHALILVLYMVYRYIYELPIFDLEEGAKLILVMILYAAIAIKEHKHNIIPKIVSVAIILPFQAYINDCELAYEFIDVCNLLLYTYSIFAIGRFFIKNEKTRDIFQSIAYSIVLLNFIFTEYFLVGLVIGVICLILILIGLNNDKYKFHFYVGVIFTILNIIYQLRDIWSVIPFWLYLLIGGLVLIFVATQKQMKKIEKK